MVSGLGWVPANVRETWVLCGMLTLVVDGTVAEASATHQRKTHSARKQRHDSLPLLTELWNKDTCPKVPMICPRGQAG